MIVNRANCFILKENIKRGKNINSAPEIHGKIIYKDLGNKAWLQRIIRITYYNRQHKAVKIAEKGNTRYYNGKLWM